MLFGLRFRMLEHYNSFEKSLQSYSIGARPDLEKLEIFLKKTWDQDVFSKQVSYKLKSIKLDEYDFGITCKVNKRGEILISIGCLIAIDSFASLIAESMQFQSFTANRDFNWLNERFPLFVNYYFLNKINGVKSSDGYYNPFFSCFPLIPDDDNAFGLWRLTANMLVGCLISHEFGHIVFQHTNHDNPDILKGYELEADSYSIHKTFLDYFNVSFLKAVDPIIDSKIKLYSFLSNITLSIHGLLIGWLKSNNTIGKVTNNEKYPSPEVRLINSICSIVSAGQSASSVNDLLKKEVNFEIDLTSMIFFITYSIRNVDWALRVGGKYPILNYSEIKLELVNDPTNSLHARFVVLESVVKKEIKHILTKYSIKYWLWVNQYNHFNDPNYEIWRSIIEKLYSERREEWTEWAKVTTYNLENNSTLICISRFFLNCIENIETENEVESSWVIEIENFIENLFKKSTFF